MVSKLVGGDCALVQPGDRVGVMTIESPGAVGYTFQPSKAGALGSTLNKNSNNVSVGMELEFEALTFPYEFSMAGYIDTSELLINNEINYIQNVCKVPLPHICDLSRCHPFIRPDLQ